MQLFSSNFKLGILGGGQLGKMLLYDAKRYDLHTKVMDSNNEAPCAKIADEFIVGDITNYQDVINFGNKVDIITVEIEKINTDALLDLEKKGKKVYPSAKTLQIIQNKSDQKDFYKINNLPTSRFKNYLDHIYSIFPFEEKLLAKEDMSSSFTGHPLAEHFEIDVDKREFKSKMSLNSKKIYIALLPGSRKSELKNHLKILEKVASSYFSSNPNYHFIIALTEENPISEDRYLKKENISLIKGNTREVLKACDYAIVSSGTATLEAMLSKTPFCVIYKSNSISNFIITNLLLKLDFISLPNILANKKIVPELRQKDLKIKKVIKELNCLIENSNEEMIKEFKILHQSLINENDNKFSKIIDKLSLEF